LRRLTSRYFIEFYSLIHRKQNEDRENEQLHLLQKENSRQNFDSIEFDCLENQNLTLFIK